MRSVTKQAVREARLKEIKQELLTSEKLKVRDGYSCTERSGGGGTLLAFCDWTFLLSLRHILRITPEICSYSDMTKTSILLWSNPT